MNCCGLLHDAASVRGRVNVATLNLRAAPDTAAAILSKLARGTELELVGRTPAGDWVQTARGGWVAARCVRARGELAALPVTR